ncbi:3-dehydrosphinganine reductase [Marasmius tenuissimus]|nr:3-dehydrosphinganine reductase [Marasmius tenuissimus]
MLSVPVPTTPTAIVPLVSSALLLLATLRPFSVKWDPHGQHCYITGESAGLGLALAVLLIRAGAHVSLVASDEQKLQVALAELGPREKTYRFRSWSTLFVRSKFNCSAPTDRI